MKQPTKDELREQLALAADEIIRLGDPWRMRRVALASSLLGWCLALIFAATVQ